jgi:hypothetical protein
MAVGGLAMITLSFLVYSETTPFPFPGALVPCIGTALLIWAGGSCVTSKLWTNRPLIWTGRISYSLYLVHWPLIIFYTYWKFVPPTLFDRVGLVAGSFALALPLHVFVERRFRRSQVANLSDTSFMRISVGLAIVVIAVAFTAKLDDGWPWRVAPQHLNPSIVAKLSPWCREDAGLCGELPGTAALIGDSHADHFAGAVAESLKQARVRGILYQPGVSCGLMQDSYVVVSLSERKTNPCRTGQREWRERIEAENPAVVILSSFWLRGLSNRYPHRYVDDHSTAMPDIQQSRARFERKMTETFDWLIANHRKVVIIRSVPLVDRPPTACYGRPEVFTSPDCSKLNVVSDPEAEAYLSAFLRGLVASRSTDALYVDVPSVLCDGNQCPLGENGTSFYYDVNHLTNYGAMWVQSRAFKPMTDFIKAMAPSQ